LVQEAMRTRFAGEPPLARQISGSTSAHADAER
jgi:hypothetical protein